VVLLKAALERNAESVLLIRDKPLVALGIQNR
jgi:hypothetical protein